MNTFYTKIAFASLAGLIYISKSSTVEALNHSDIRWDETLLIDSIQQDYRGFAAFSKSLITTRDGGETIQKPESDWMQYETLLARYE